MCTRGHILSTCPHRPYTSRRPAQGTGSKVSVSRSLGRADRFFAAGGRPSAARLLATVHMGCCGCATALFAATATRVPVSEACLASWHVECRIKSCCALNTRPHSEHLNLDATIFWLSSSGEWRLRSSMPVSCACLFRNGGTLGLGVLRGVQSVLRCVLAHAGDHCDKWLAS